MKTFRSRALLALVLVLTSAACGAGVGAGPRPVGTSRLHLTPQEMQNAVYSDVYAAVETLRPSWLREYTTSLQGGPERVQVYLDGMKLGGPEMLRGISATSVGHLEFLSAIEASQRYGLNHGAGAILVSTLRR
ncbi:MAG TPA: hypothetical protein VE913_12365 [Longimicrobium sp.]|nr:hypothetical protein [Longimicrobium sp.]